ncbi:hypothetical protein ISN44_Un22g000010 [Arabidopsis suecica]|uniref:Nucleotide-sugar transporter family protein n=1 Tax=Arabidopsis suecica TaxID=45249 RepID=A0A8T1XEQ9_ARASU|nr:hypothetical protein ISN44_Un22g000010 [Arabidopsis suecica]
MYVGDLTTLSQSNGGYKYDYATVPFLAEVFKLIVSGLFLWREMRTSSSTTSRITTDWKSVRLFVIPSLIYLIHNNVQFATLTYVDTSYLSDNGLRDAGKLHVILYSRTNTRLFAGHPLSWFVCSSRNLHRVSDEEKQRHLILANLQLYTFGSLFNVARLIADDFRHGFERVLGGNVSLMGTGSPLGW